MHLNNIVVNGAFITPFLFYYMLFHANIDIYRSAYVYHELGEFEQCTALLKKVYPDQKKSTARLLKLHALRTMQWDEAASYELQKLWWYNFPIAGKKIFIKHDGGIGDAIQFLRYAKHLHAAGAYVIIETPPTLCKIYTLCPYIDQCVPMHTVLSDIDFTITVSTPTLTFTMSDTLTEPSSDTPYLYADEQLCHEWRTILSIIQKPKIGICWCSAPCYNKNTGEKMLSPRSIPLTNLACLYEREDCTFISLQSGFGLEQLKNTMPILCFPDLDNIHGHFMDTIAIMHTLDLVITMDTSIAHIAGALGIPVWIILPACSDFRWFTERSDSPWYPTMRLFRQKPYENWNPVIQQVAYALTDFLKN